MKSGLLKSRVNFLSVENDLILVWPFGNDGCIGQYFVFLGKGLAGVNASKEEQRVGGDRSKISLIFNWFRKIKKDCR